MLNKTRIILETLFEEENTPLRGEFTAIFNLLVEEGFVPSLDETNVKEIVRQITEERKVTFAKENKEVMVIANDEIITICSRLLPSGKINYLGSIAHAKNEKNNISTYTIDNAIIIEGSGLILEQMRLNSEYQLHTYGLRCYKYYDESNLKLLGYPSYSKFIAPVASVNQNLCISRVISEMLTKSYIDPEDRKLHDIEGNGYQSFAQLFNQYVMEHLVPEKNLVDKK